MLNIFIPLWGMLFVLVTERNSVTIPLPSLRRSRGGGEQH